MLAWFVKNRDIAVMCAFTRGCVCANISAEILRYFSITCYSASIAAGVVFGLLQPAGLLESLLLWVGQAVPAALLAVQPQGRRSFQQAARTGRALGYKNPGFAHRG